MRISNQTELLVSHSGTLVAMAEKPQTLATTTIGSVDSSTVTLPLASHKLDCGRSWFVLFGAFVSVAFTMGNALSLGTLFRPVAERVRATSGEQPSTLSLTVLFALCLALNYMTGMCAAAITAMVGYRRTIAAGATLAALGFALSAAATRVWHLYLTMGILTGFGFGLTYTPAIGVLSYYFSQRYMNLAGGVAATGSSAGIMFYSRIHPLLAANLSWTGAMLIEAAMCVMLLTSVIAIRYPDNASPPTLSAVIGEKTEISLKGDEDIRICELSTSTLDSALTSLDSNEDAFENNIAIARDSVDLNGQAVQEIRRKLSKISKSQIVDEKVSNPASSATKNTVINRLFRPELFRLAAFYLLMLEGTAVLANFFFLILTPAYPTGTQAWSSAKAAGTILTVYGAAALSSRVCVCLVNSRPNLAKKIPKTLQIGTGILLNTSAAIVFLSAKSVNPTALTAGSTALPVLGWLEEPNARLFAAFAALCGLGGTFTIAYQPPLLHEVLPSEFLTASFGYMNVVLGVLTLALCPVAGIFADLFGTLRYAYAICLIFCSIGMVALVAVGVVIIRRKNHVLSCKQRGRRMFRG